VRLPFSGGRKLTLGTVSPHLSFTTFDLNEAEQRYHGLVVGKSGAGKSKFLQSVFQSYVQRSLAESTWLGRYSSHGTTVLEPHHDLSFDILSSLVASGFYRRYPDAYQRVVYVDFGLDYYVPFNVLSGGGEPHETASLCLDAILRVFPELETAPLFTELFLSGGVVLIENKLPLTYLQRLFADRAFRTECLKRLPHDEVVQLTFQNFERLGREQAEAAGSTLRRAFQLVFNATTRLSLGQPDNLLPLRKFMDEGRFLILNLGGVRDQLSRRILGAMLMVQLEQAALSRTDLLPAERVPHSILVDEWPVFAATEGSLSHILSQARKFALNIYLACQSLSQISEKRLAGAFENCKLGVFFALGHESAEISSRQIGDLDPYHLKEAQNGSWSSQEDFRSPTAHIQYFPLLEQIQLWTNELKGLSPRYCYIKVDSKKAVKVRTQPVPTPRVDKAELEMVLSTYRSLYQRSRSQAEQAMSNISLPDVPVRDDVGQSYFETGLDWEEN
jgi:hypothetical protein